MMARMSLWQRVVAALALYVAARFLFVLAFHGSTAAGVALVPVAVCLVPLTWSLISEVRSRFSKVTD